jgi:hypothetical protein
MAIIVVIVIFMVGWNKQGFMMDLPGAAWVGSPTILQGRNIVAKPPTMQGKVSRWDQKGTG